jgi:hypothetical protein
MLLGAARARGGEWERRALGTRGCIHSCNKEGALRPVNYVILWLTRVTEWRTARWYC